MRSLPVLPRLLASALAVSMASTPAGAWNATGHRIVAAIAYDNLTSAARARADALIRSHPDFATLFETGNPGDARAAFIAASYWPDIIRSDPRFYDNTRADAQPTPQLPGFPDMGRHTNWHYFDLPFSQDGAQRIDQRPPHALSEIQRLLRVVRGRDAVAASYALPWLLHLVGDVHNPLHTTSRFSKQIPGGDQGGNLVFIAPQGNLHALWDAAGGSDPGAPYVNGMAEEIAGEYRAKGNSVARAERNPRKWINEGFALAKSNVYNFGLDSGTRERPITLPPGYQNAARELARKQLASAGFRLAAVLNAALDR